MQDIHLKTKLYSNQLLLTRRHKYGEIWKNVTHSVWQLFCSTAKLKKLSYFREIFTIARGKKEDC